MFGRYILDDADNPIPCEDLMAWARWTERFNLNRKVFQKRIGPYFVSTVFLGLDHNFAGYGPPVLFETMVFSDLERHHNSLMGREISGDVFQDRCCTKEEARLQFEQVYDRYYRHWVFGEPLGDDDSEKDESGAQMHGYTTEDSDGDAD